MTETQRSTSGIEITENGPYGVRGVNLARLRPVNDDNGKPVEWEFYESLDPQPDDNGVTWLCRCGQSGSKPYCDGSHNSAAFDGTETAPREGFTDRAEITSGTEMELLDDESLCTHAGYCVTKGNNVWKMVGQTDDPQVRERFETMVGHCPSGRIAYRSVGEDDLTEPDLPNQIGVADNGPYVVTGGVEIHGADGEAYEVRNRVSLCRCGASGNLPFCDATHTDIGFTDKG